MLAHDGEDFVTMVGGYYKLFVQSDVSIFESNIGDPEVQEDPTIPLYRGQHDVIPEVWSYTNEIMNGTNVFTDQNANSVKYDEISSPIPTDMQPVDLTCGPPSYREKFNKDNGWPSQENSVISLHGGSGPVFTSSQVYGEDFKFNAPLASPDVSLISSTASSNITNDSDYVTWYAYQSSADDLSPTLREDYDIFANGNSADEALVNNDELRLQIGLSPDNDNRFSIPTLQTFSIPEPDYDLADDSTPTKNSTFHYDPDNVNFVKSQHVCDNLSDLNYDDYIKEHSGDYSLAEDADTESFSDCPEFSDGEDDTDTIETPEASPKKTKSSIHTSHLMNNEQSQSFGLRTSDVITESKHEFDQLTTNDLQNSEDISNVTDVKVVVHPSYNSQLFCDGGIYLDPEIIDLTLFPPPKTPENVGIIDFSGSEMMSLPPPGFADPQFLPFGYIACDEDEDEDVDPEIPADALPPDIADLPTPIREQLDALVNANKELSLQLDDFDALFLSNDAEIDEATQCFLNGGYDFAESLKQLKIHEIIDGDSISETDSGHETATSDNFANSGAYLEFNGDSSINSFQTDEQFDSLDLTSINLSDDIDSFISGLMVPPPPNDFVQIQGFPLCNISNENEYTYIPLKSSTPTVSKSSTPLPSKLDSNNDFQIVLEEEFLKLVMPPPPSSDNQCDISPFVPPIEDNTFFPIENSLKASNDNLQRPKVADLVRKFHTESSSSDTEEKNSSKENIDNKTNQFIYHDQNFRPDLINPMSHNETDDVILPSSSSTSSHHIISNGLNSLPYNSFSNQDVISNKQVHSSSSPCAQLSESLTNTPVIDNLRRHSSSVRSADSSPIHKGLTLSQQLSGSSLTLSGSRNRLPPPPPPRNSSVSSHTLHSPNSDSVSPVKSPNTLNVCDNQLPCANKGASAYVNIINSLQSNSEPNLCKVLPRRTSDNSLSSKNSDTHSDNQDVIIYKQPNVFQIDSYTLKKDKPKQLTTFSGARTLGCRRQNKQHVNDNIRLRTEAITRAFQSTEIENSESKSSDNQEIFTTTEELASSLKSDQPVDLLLNEHIYSNQERERSPSFQQKLSTFENSIDTESDTTDSDLNSSFNSHTIDRSHTFSNMPAKSLSSPKSSPIPHRSKSKGKFSGRAASPLRSLFSSSSESKQRGSSESECSSAPTSPRRSLRSTFNFSRSHSNSRTFISSSSTQSKDSNKKGIPLRVVHPFMSSNPANQNNQWLSAQNDYHASTDDNRSTNQTFSTFRGSPKLSIRNALESNSSTQNGTESPSPSNYSMHSPWFNSSSSPSEVHSSSESEKSPLTLPKKFSTLPRRAAGKPFETPNVPKLFSPNGVIKKTYKGYTVLTDVGEDTKNLFEYLDKTLIEINLPSCRRPTEEFQPNKEILVAESRQFVTDSKLLVSSATQSMERLIENINNSIHTLAKIVHFTKLTMVTMTMLPQAQAMGSCVKDVIQAYNLTVSAAYSAAGRPLNDPQMKALMRQATSLAAILSSLMKTLKILENDT